MRLPYQVFIALRYLKSKKKLKGVSLSTAISISGVAVGVMALLVVLSVMSGFHEDLQRKILGVSSHLVIMNFKNAITDHTHLIDEIKKVGHVKSASPFVLGQAMISSGERAHGVYVRGIDPELESKTTEIDAHMKEGSLASLTDTKDSTPGIILGRELSDRLGAFVGDTVRIVSPFGGMGPMGNMPRVKKFRVKGIFEVGMFEYDSNLVLTTIPPAQEFFDMEGAVSGIELRLDDIYLAHSVGEDIKKKLGFPFYAKDWMQMNRNLFAALKLEKLVMFVILTLIVLVAAMNIISTQIMNVIEKQREIAILKAMGATDNGIMGIFMIQGFYVGLVGTVIGLVSGLVLCYLINDYEIIKLPPDVYYLSHLPAKVNVIDFTVVTLSALIISFLATVYPARRAARLDPVEILRYE